MARESGLPGPAAEPLRQVPFLVDCSGHVLWRAEGERTPELLAELEAALP